MLLHSKVCLNVELIFIYALMLREDNTCTVKVVHLMVILLASFSIAKLTKVTTHAIFKRALQSYVTYVWQFLTN